MIVLNSRGRAGGRDHCDSPRATAAVVRGSDRPTQTAFEAIEHKLDNVPSPLVPSMRILIAPHWEVFSTFDAHAHRLDLLANSEVVQAFGAVADRLDQLRQCTKPSRFRVSNSTTLGVLKESSQIPRDSLYSNTTDAAATAAQLDAFALAVSRQVNPHWAPDAHSLTDAESQRARHWLETSAGAGRPLHAAPSPGVFDPAARVWPVSVVDAMGATLGNELA